MVKVWYQPPPYGPRTALDRPAYGIGAGDTPKWLVRFSKLPRWQSVGGTVAAFCVLAYLPLCKFVCVLILQDLYNFFVLFFVSQLFAWLVLYTKQ